ncbi:MAG: hypothetical protein Q9188_002032 [Gyalolechia gomerana]
MAVSIVRGKLEACIASLDSLVRFSKGPEYKYEAKIHPALWQHQLDALNILSLILGINNVRVFSLESYLATSSSNLDEILDELEELEIELMETQGLVRYGVGDEKETSTHREPEEVSATDRREARALRAIISTDLETVRVWSRHQLIAQKISRLYTLAKNR